MLSNKCWVILPGCGQCFHLTWKTAVKRRDGGRLGLVRTLEIATLAITQEDLCRPLAIIHLTAALTTTLIKYDNSANMRHLNDHFQGDPGSTGFSLYFLPPRCLQCSDAVGWAPGRASGL